ncbi:BrnT family toxin [Duganella phyllosphaerae]|uniref:BrnT family toxin n=1 Tax=Duganella phyllosphaerae TaxID=762836 RepID=UPI0008FCA716|nr:BrnT family toxin [Duganella phyllosphaerae]
MRITFDAAKRQKTRVERGLDFALAGEVFAGLNVTASDDRKEYGELRYITTGFLGGRVVVWTPRGRARRVISMRRANEREIAKFSRAVG